MSVTASMDTVVEVQRQLFVIKKYSRHRLSCWLDVKPAAGLADVAPRMHVFIDSQQLSLIQLGQHPTPSHSSTAGSGDRPAELVAL